MNAGSGSTTWLRSWFQERGIDPSPATELAAALDDIMRAELAVALTRFGGPWPIDLLNSLETLDDVYWYASRRSTTYEGIA